MTTSPPFPGDAADQVGPGHPSRPGRLGRGRGRGVRISALGLAGVVVLGGLVVGGVAAVNAFRGSGAPEIGDCLEAAEESDGNASTSRRARRVVDGPREPRVVGCDDDAAVHVVLGERPADADPTTCLGVDGATATVASTEPHPRTLCVGPVGADPALSVNTVVPGDCVLVDGDKARRAECGTAGAARVVGVVEDGTAVPDVISGVLAACVDAGYDDAESLYTWSIDRDLPVSRLSWDRGLCLAPEGATS